MLRFCFGLLMVTYPHRRGAQNVLFVQIPPALALTRRSYDACLF